MLLKTKTATLLLTLCAPLALGACGSDAPEPVETEAVDVPVAADAPEGVSLTGAEVRMPAVSGRPGVAYFTIASETPRTIASVSVLGAERSEIHETNMVDGKMTMAVVDTIDLQPGEPLNFQPGGYHVMLFDMDATIAPGSTADVTISFADGDKASIQAPVTGAGGMDHSAMEGMD
ncbi:copper chaperone PCu(A)C [Croceicoccus pelagius]|uniref:Copper chaperone PCu(A)C n=1 Tax=Croceicoccus pelagius TaxID=1703341 RepID=A0A917DLS3_9SPHN|nr:copper chaperone PCu(A)C [Croceicoccus pelagius]GGD46764.1 hypothetical protein GCM10010989_21330 [Croceicoccus pelagius]